MEDQVSADIQRSLGRIEGSQMEMSKAQTKIFSLLENLEREFQEHKGEDRNNFQMISSRMGNLEKSIIAHDASNEEADEHRATELGARDKAILEVKAELKIINDYVENIKGAWWLIGIIAILIASFGALVTWAISVWKARHGS